MQFESELCAENLRRLRQLRGVSVNEVAHKADVPAHLLKAYENGHQPMMAQHLMRLSQYYRVSLDELVGRSGWIMQVGRKPRVGCDVDG